MKKILFVLTITFGFAASLAAQELTSKKGVPILPEEGEYALGVDATQMFNYFGNFFNGTVGNTVNWNHPYNSQMIMGKYFLSPTQAYRAGVRIGYGSWSATNLVTDDNDATKTLEDKAIQNMMNLTLSFGKEYRRGKGRVQGFYGAEGMLMLNNSGQSYEYGNAMSATNATPTSTNWTFPAMGNPIAGAAIANGARMTEMKNGFGFGFGLRAFLGAEYFILPKVSIGGEFGWGLTLMTTGAATTTTESVVAGDVTATEAEGGKNTSFLLDTDNMNGMMKIMFHF